MSQERYNPDAHRPHRTFEEAARQQASETCVARLLGKPHPRDFSDGITYAAVVREHNDIEDHPEQAWNA